MNWRYFFAGVAVGLYIKPRISKQVSNLLRVTVADAASAAVERVLFPEGRRPGPVKDADSYEAYQRWLRLQKENG